MKGSLRMNMRKPRIILRSPHLISINRSMCFSNHMRNKTPISHTTSRTSTHHRSHTYREGVEENSEEEVEKTLEDEVVEGDLVRGEVQLHAITVDN